MALEMNKVEITGRSAPSLTPLPCAVPNLLKQDLDMLGNFHPVANLKQT